MAALNSEIAGGSAIRSQIVGDQTVGNEAVCLQKFAHQFQRSVLVSLGLDQNIEDFAFSVDGAPKIDHAVSDFQIDFIQMPGRVRSGAELCGKVGDGENQAADLISATSSIPFLNLTPLMTLGN